MEAEIPQAPQQNAYVNAFSPPPAYNPDGSRQEPMPHDGTALQTEDMLVPRIALETAALPSTDIALDSFGITVRDPGK